MIENETECEGCGFGVMSDVVNPDDLTQKTGVEPSNAIPPHLPIVDKAGRARGKGHRGLWLIQTHGRIASKNANDHLRYLFSLLAPHREILQDAAAGGTLYFTISWKGAGHPWQMCPTIDVDCINELAQWRAELDLKWRIHPNPATTTPWPTGATNE